MRAPPVAKKVRRELEMFGDVRVDDYYWLRDDSRSDPDVLAYLEEENEYTDYVMADTKQFQDQLFAEIKGRIKEEDVSAPIRRGPYYYYIRTLEGKEYVQHCRRSVPNPDVPASVHDIMPTGPSAPTEHVILDENVKAKDKSYFSVGNHKVSPNGKLVAYSEDTIGNEVYTIYIIDAEDGSPIGKPLKKVWMHLLNDDQSSDTCLYHEKDEIFSVNFTLSESKEFIFVGSGSKTTHFVHYLHILEKEKGLVPLTRRVNGIDTYVSHRGKQFFIQKRSDELYNSELLVCPLDDVSATSVLLPHRESVKLQDIKLFEGHLVAYERENGLSTIKVHDLPPLGELVKCLGEGRSVDFVDPIYSVYLWYSEFSSSILRFNYSSMRVPSCVYDYDMNSRTSVLKKIQTVLGGFDPSDYMTERVWATASDGTRIPISILYRKVLVKLDGTAPLLLNGYGSYEACSDPTFNSSRLSLIDRGFIYAIAHIRGGGEMGRQWYENGKLLKKMNTFSDFIACAEYLIENNYCAKDKLCIHGGSAGGLLIGVALNSRPDLFKSAVTRVPFVDALTTMLDPTIPLTTSEWEEWGDPRIKQFYYYMKSYSPIDNIKPQKYPNILVTTGLHDRRVLYSEPAKFVAKLREFKTDNNILLFKCELSAGHFSKSGRFERLKENALTYAFLLKTLGMVPTADL